MTGFRVSVLCLALPSVVLLGCPASQTWTTARTVPSGTVQHTAGVEFVGLTWECPEAATDCIEPIGFLPVPFPAYSLRVGIGDMLDFGFKASSSGSFGADLKVQLVETDFFDLALDPGVTSPFVFNFTYVTLPILFSLNFSEALTLTLYPKAAYWAVYSNDLDTAVDGVFIGGGANFQIRINEKFAITPGFEFMRSTEDRAEQGSVTFLNFGIGFSFGSFPGFGPAAEEMQMQPEPAPGYAPPPAATGPEPAPAPAPAPAPVQ